MSMEMDIIEPETFDRRGDEREAFSKVTAALASADTASLHSALDDNRRLWSILQDNLFQEDNVLPDSLKSQLISLATWVDGYTAKVLEGEGDVEALISVNTTIMEGLA